MTRRLLGLSFVCCLALGCAGGAPMTEITTAEERGRLTDEIARTLDELHAAASAADEERYFGLFASDGVFLGTDASERWTVAEFRAYAHPHFSQGKGWTYTPRQRHVVVAADGTTAVFDELLENAGLGTCRGSGALRREAKGEWRVVLYDLSIPIPNDLAKDVAARIRAHGGK
ncbi:MAG: nuclear transport factor 2 family protein [Planctomycetota bacterium]